MSLTEFLIVLLVAAVIGSLGQALAGYRLGGCAVSIGLGFIGALLGFWLARQLRLPEFLVVQIGSETFPVIWSVIGAALFALIVGLMTRRRWRY